MENFKKWLLNTIANNQSEIHGTNEIDVINCIRIILDLENIPFELIYDNKSSDLANQKDKSIFILLNDKNCNQYFENLKSIAERPIQVFVLTKTQDSTALDNAYKDLKAYDGIYLITATGNVKSSFKKNIFFGSNSSNEREVIGYFLFPLGNKPLEDAFLESINSDKQILTHYSSVSYLKCTDIKIVYKYVSK